MPLDAILMVAPMKKGIFGRPAGLFLLAPQNNPLKLAFSQMNCFLDLQDPAAFLRELTEKQPALEVQPDGSLRRRGPWQTPHWQPPSQADLDWMMEVRRRLDE